MSITYRTDDITRWGTGQGSDLSAAQIDINFYELASAIQDLQDNPVVGAGIDYFVVVGDQLWVHLTDHSTKGPYTIPTSAWNFRSEGWQPLTVYAPLDVFAYNGALYLVLFDHTSAATFDAGATDGLGNNYYGLLLDVPAAALPVGGSIRQALRKASAADFDTEWTSDTKTIGMFFAGSPEPSENLLTFAVAEPFMLPLGLTAGKSASSLTPPTTSQIYAFFKNGSAIGHVEFLPLGGPIFAFTADVSFAVDDLFSVIGPAAPDPHQTDISITLISLRL